MNNFIDIGNLEKMSELQKKNGSYNFLLTICMTLTILSIGTIIWQNTKALESISNKLNVIATSNTALTNQMRIIENKVDLLFLERYEIKPKTITTKK
ncbi:MAG: hypothetical protein ACRC45_03845 [Cetobacterium sp.]